jgi:ATP-binding cassette subfamily C protein
MARQAAGRGAGTVLQEAIEDVLRAASGWLWLVLGMGVVAALLTFATVQNRMYIVGYVGTTHSWPSLLSACIFWVSITVLMVALRYLQNIAVSSISGYAARRLAVPAVLATAQRAGRAETLASEAVRDVELLRTSLAGPVSSAAVDAVLTPLLVVLVFVLHWSYGILALFYCGVAAVLSLLITRAANRAVQVGSGGTMRAFGLAADAMRSGEAILAMGMLPRLARQWVAASTEAGAETWLATQRAARLRSALELLLGTFRGAIILLGAALALSGESLNVVLAGALFMLSRLTAPFVGIGTNSHEIAEGLAAWRRLRALVDGSPMPPAGIAFPCPQGRLVVEYLGFAFRGPQPTLLRSIDLTVEPGEIVGIIGASGSGKSTLLRLMVGMYRPAAGGVYLDGHATHQWDRRDLARHVGFLPQEPLLSRGTVAEVIARLEAPDMALVPDAARRAGAHETIIGLPLGYATPLAGSAWQLSMGQRQRIALARALYGRPKLLLLDELAGSMDAAGEAHVAALLEALREEGTSVVFTTHRPSLLAAADRVLGLRNGVLVPAGRDQPKLAGAPPLRLTGQARSVGISA